MLTACSKPFGIWKLLSWVTKDMEWHIRAESSYFCSWPYCICIYRSFTLRVCLHDVLKMETFSLAFLESFAYKWQLCQNDSRSRFMGSMKMSKIAVLFMPCQWLVMLSLFKETRITHTYRLNMSIMYYIYITNEKSPWSCSLLKNYQFLWKYGYINWGEEVHVV